MIRGLLKKILWEVRIPTMLFATALFVVMFLLTSLLPKVLGDFHKFFDKLPFVKPLITALLGMDPGDDGLTAAMMQAFLWVHPTVLTILWAHELMYCSRVPAAEIDRGSIDFLLGLPISRWNLFKVETLGWLFSGLFILSIGFAGHALAATQLQPSMQPHLFAVVSIMVNLFCIYLAVGAVAFLVSTNSDRRGRAIGIMFGILLLSFLLNFLAQFWAPAQTISFLSVMEYYRPAAIIQENKFPIKDVIILCLISVTAWTVAGIRFSKRSICTV